MLTPEQHQTIAQVWERQNTEPLSLSSQQIPEFAEACDTQLEGLLAAARTAVKLQYPSVSDNQINRMLMAIASQRIQEF